MKKVIKVQEQVICDLVGTYGGAVCPYCKVRCDLIAVNNRLLAPRTCEHVVQAVAAGIVEVAIHFVAKREIA